jgi:hypothetical protein
MNALAAGDIEAADLLALARLDDDGAPGRCGPGLDGADGRGPAIDSRRARLPNGRA